VDDEPDILYLIKRIIEKQGYEVLTAENGRTCLEKAKKHKPDLVLLDIMMPDLSGWDVSVDLKSNDESKDVPVVISKPAKSREILETINTLLLTSSKAKN
jgi:two-component system sensor histidine kinase/response regulator